MNHDDIPRLMRAQIAAEMALYDPWQPMPPPRAGDYLVRCETTDDGTTHRYVRLDYYDGARWPRMGGYVAYTGWMETPGV